MFFPSGKGGIFLKEKNKKEKPRNLNATVAKMHAVYGKRLRQEDYMALLACPTVSDAAVYLKNHTYFHRTLEGIDTSSVHRGNLENILLRSLMDNYFRIIDFEKIDEDDFYGYKTVKTEIDEILICIQCLNAGTGDHITTLPIYMNKYTSFNLMELAKVTSFSELISLTEKTPYADILREFAPKDRGAEEEHIDYAGCELKLRTYYYKRLLGSLKAFGSETRTQLKDFIAMQIDIINIINSYRMKKFFSADAEGIRARMIPIYLRVSEDKMDALYSAHDEKDFKTLLSGTYYGREMAAGGIDISDTENALARLRFIRAKTAFGRAFSAPVCFYTFNCLAETEVRNIIRIIEGIRYGLPSKDIAELIIS